MHACKLERNNKSTVGCPHYTKMSQGSGHGGTFEAGPGCLKGFIRLTLRQYVSVIFKRFFPFGSSERRAVTLSRSMT